MIAVGLVLLTVGAVDLVREFAPRRRRWISLGSVGLAIVVLGILTDAILPALLALAVATTWVWLSPGGVADRAGMWPIAGLAIVCAALLVIVPVRADAGLIGHLGPITSPVGPLSFDHVVLLAGAFLFLLESANVAVRTALLQGRVPGVTSAVVDPPAADAASAPSAEEDDEVTAPAVTPVLKGGRLIGPLERLLVLGLTLAGMYPLVAAILAAKGIVRFPEISRDSRDGNRAEYFLIGSLVSWALALGAALLIWWAFATTLP